MLPSQCKDIFDRQTYYAAYFDSCRRFGTTYGNPSSGPSLTLEDGTVRLDVTQCRLVIIYRRFGTTYEPHTQGSSLNYIFFIYPAVKVSIFNKRFLKASVGPI
jgi:hypothetical protein